MSMNNDGKQTIGDLMKHWHEVFEKENISEPKESIQHIIAAIIETKKISDLIKLRDEKLNEEQLEKLKYLCECRLSRMPIQYLVGQWDFRNITLKMEPPVFIPRPATETFVELVLEKIKDFGNKPRDILEIGCGSGAICLSLLHAQKNIRVVAIDANPRACELTRKNAMNLNLKLGLTLLNAKLNESGNITVKKDYTSSQPLKFEQLNFDFIVSNPPYLPTNKMYNVQPDAGVYEDISAFDGGVDGLKFIKPILLYATVALRKNGIVLLEIDSINCENIRNLVEENYTGKLRFVSSHKDLKGKNRYVEIQRIK